MKALMVVLVVSALGCSDKGVYVGANPDANGSDGYHATTLTSLNDTCTAPPPPGYLNPNNIQQFVASPATGAGVLALLTGPHTATYRPQGVPQGYTWHGSLASTAIAIDAHYSTGMVTCSPLQCSCDPPGPCGLDRCSGPFVSVEVDGTFMTADGVFNEHVDSTLTARAGDGALDLEGILPATELHGTYMISFGTPSQVSLYFLARFAGQEVLPGDVSEVGPSISGGGGSIM
jgi:hypothetical protein